MTTKTKKTALDVVINSFLRRVEEQGTMPWQNPHYFGTAINWKTKKMYRGINRILLPSGEYLTKKQLNEYNESHGTDYRFQKGIVWLPVVFYSNNLKPVDSSVLEGRNLLEGGRVVVDGKTYIKKDGNIFLSNIVLRYSYVAEVQHFKDSKGNDFPRRIGTTPDAELLQTLSEPQEVIDGYLARSGVKFEVVDDGRSFYQPSTDLVHVNEVYKSVEGRYSTTFHELAHSTGATNRLNRTGITSPTGFGSPDYAFEECIAEITASLLCHETGVSTFVTSGTETYDNSATYVAHWSKYIADNKAKFLSICKQAEAAYFYILGEDEANQLTGTPSKEV